MPLGFSGTVRAQSEQIYLLNEDRIHVRDILADRLPDVAAASPLRMLDLQKDVIAGAGQALLGEFKTVRVSQRDYSRGSRKFRVEFFEMGQPSRALGLFAFLDHPTLSQAADTAKQQPHTDSSIADHFDRFVIRVTPLSPANAGEGVSAPAKALAATVLNRVRVRFNKDTSEPPTVFKDLPSEGQLPYSARLIFGPAGLGHEVNYLGASSIRFDTGSKVALARYRDREGEIVLALIEYQTPQLATEGFAKLRQIDASITQPGQKPLLKREGNYLVAAFGYHDEAAAKALVDKVKYSYTVKYLATPPTPRFDYAKYRREAYQMLVGILWLVVSVTCAAFLLGATYGVSLFVRRYRRSRDAFSDAGGMLRLNLDRILPAAPTDVSSRLLKKGE